MKSNGHTSQRRCVDLTGIRKGLRVTSGEGASIPVSKCSGVWAGDGDGGFIDKHTTSATLVGGPQVEKSI